MEKKPFRSGYVALIGRPNVGKSTLLNKLLGQKVAIVSPKPQTTRHQFSGIVSTDNYQIVFLDTPGLLNPRYKLHRYMLKSALAALEGADLVLYLIDIHDRPEDLSKKLPEQSDIIFKNKFKNKRLLAINKIDLVGKSDILPLMKTYHEQGIFDEIIPISALHNEGIDRLKEVIVDRIPYGEPFYPLDQLSDVSERFIVSEFIREKVFVCTQNEIPYASTVLVEDFKERTNKIYISAVIYVLKNSQKAVLIGKNGQMIRRIGAEARQAIESFLDQSVYLDLWVKVRKDWRKHDRDLNYFGYR